MSRGAAQVVAIVPAAGSGVRMGLGPKALLRINESTIVEHAIERIVASELVSRVIVCLRDEDRSAFGELDLGNRYRDCPVTLVTGGAVRQASVCNALLHLEAGGGIEGSDLILVHDAARCLVSPGLVRRCVEKAGKCGAVTAAVPLVDSIKRANLDMQVIESPSREDLWCVQTPQVFRFDLLLSAHKQGRQLEQRSSATDDASLVERFHPVSIVEGERLNLKITTPEDLHLARCLMVNKSPLSSGGN